MEDGRDRQQMSLPDDKKLNELVSAVADSQRKKAQEMAAAEGATGGEKGRKSRLPLLLSLVAISLVVLVLTRLAIPTAASVSPDDSARETIYSTVLALTAELDATGAFPEDLESIGMDHEGLTYSPRSDGYSLTAEEDGVTVEYSSGEDLTPFREAFQALVIPAGGGG